MLSISCLKDNTDRVLKVLLKYYDIGSVGVS